MPVSALKKLKGSLKAAGLVGPTAPKKIKKSSSGKSDIPGYKAKLAHLSESLAKNNPFELKFARPKHAILNKKVKGVTGRPSATRKRSQEVREKTLRVERGNSGRDSTLVDKRFGESNTALSLEDKMLERFMRERKTTKGGNSKGLYNLAEETGEELTHMGQSLSADMDAMGFQRVQDQEDEEEGNIDKETVQRAHFGGFDEEEESIDPTKRKSKKDIYKEIMAKSKMHKQDRQMQKQEDEELAREVDEELDEIRGLLQPAKKTLRELAEERKANDSLPPIRRFADGRFADEEEYDRFVKELQYEKRARPTDRTKTEEETALEEKKKLEDMEQERLKRMRGETIEEDDHEKGSRRKRNKNSSETKSEKPDRPSQADDLEDNVAWEASSGPASEAPLYYKDGVLQNQEIFLSSKRQRNAEDAEDDGHSGSGSEEEESGSDEEDSEASDSGDDGSNSEMESETDARVKESHLDQEGLDDSEEEQNMAIEENEESMKGSSGSEEEMEDHEEEEEEPQNAAKVSSMASATQELPYTFEAPSDIDAFLSLIKGISAEDVATVIHRIRVMYHKKLHPDNKQKLETLTRILYQYVDYLCSTYPVSLSSIDLITKHILELTQEYTDQVAQFAKTRIISMRSRLTKSLIAKRQSVMPLASELLFMKLMVHIFPGSDAVHTVMTPLILLMAQYLGQGVIKTEQDLASGLFISQLLLETQKLSKRYIPELVNFLYGSLFCFSSESMETLKAGPLANRVKVMGLKDCLNAEPTPVSFGQLLSPQASRQWTTGEQASLLSLTFDCTTEMIRLYSDLPSLVEILSYISAVLNAIDAKHPTIKDQMVEVKSKLEMSLSSAKLKRRPLEMQKRKAIPIQTYQPQFQTHYSVDKRYKANRDEAQMDKLKFQHKKEMKGAIRELRKDADFISREKLKETKTKDSEYKKKMDKIMGQLTAQEGAMRGYEKEKKKKSRKKF